MSFACPRNCLVLALALSAFVTIRGQSLQDRQRKIRLAVESNEYASGVAELGELAKTQPSLFALNNYGYLLGRLAERQGDIWTAASSYHKLVAERSILSEYGLWHLAQIARLTGNLMLEREQLRQLLVTAPGSQLRNAAFLRLGQSYFE